MTSTSERISKSSTILLNGPLEEVFTLFGPVREMEWAAGWEPEIVYGTPELIEEHMIFQTRGHAGEEKYTWAISQYRPEEHLIEYTVSTSQRIWFIRVQCETAGVKTHAMISYTYTGLTEKGNEMNRMALEKMFTNDLKDWEEALNYYLETGKRLENS